MLLEWRKSELLLQIQKSVKYANFLFFFISLPEREMVSALVESPLQVVQAHLPLMVVNNHLII